ncbi:predicted protein [Histoplasma mississippiense (nom. inval.)]|uniref:predicted protein n=1 Tax=Ajellomyces capsulatus (strain NAm1 / WU24) TaxID=2059318 RepID=UPI000157B4E0|nr:predicted protein [Histoplasma mississippiense (nom. inval.)]EDN02368.1 predicted protein [Histoplasma mississippiense (nom. inval.)]
MINKMDDIEKCIQNAIEVYNGNQKQKILPLACKFNIPYQHLQYTFQTCDIYNFDEIGVQEDQGCGE